MASPIFKEFICLILLFFISLPAFSEQKTIAILLPEENTTLSPVYNQIIEGINDSTADLKKETLFLKANNKEEIGRQLLSDKITLIVCIGNEAAEFAFASSTNLPILVTGILFQDDNKYSGVSLSLSDAKIIKKIQHFSPHLKRLHIGDQGQHIIQFSTSDSGSLEFIRTAIDPDEKAIVRYLWKTINEANPETDAVWVNNHIDRLFVYKLSELAWDRKVTLISNNTDYLESGILLAFYPDFKGMGKRVGEIINSMTQKPLTPTVRQMESLAAIQSGISLRTAKHLSIQVPSAIESQFGIIIK